MLISNTAIKNRTTVFVLMALIAIAGGYSYITLPREAAPDVPIPWVLVTTPYEGASPTEVETQVTIEIENKLTGLKGVKEMTSSSAEGTSVVMIEFQPEIRIEDALQYVRDKIDLAKAELPDEADEPVIKEINVADFPILIISMSGDISPVRMKAIADELEDAIEQVPGVLEVDILGALEREIRIEIDPDRVAAYGLTIPELLTRIGAENVNISAGGLETQGTKFNVRLQAEFDKVEDIFHLPLTERNKKTIYLTDVVTVRDAFKDRDSYARLDGMGSITINVRKTTGANIVDVADNVKAVLAEAQKQVPSDVRIETILDQSKDIRMIVADLENNVITGLILVVAVLLAFMGWRTSSIVATAIPMSMLISFAILQSLGYTLNMIVLFSLILALGMLVDNAIVIVENIFRHRQMGYGRIEASMKGAAEVAWPVIASTATTIAAFMPMIAWPGIMGDFMKYLPITLIITLSSSLFVALVISPTLCAVFSGKVRKVHERHPFIHAYRRLLDKAVHHWAVTLGLVVLILIGMVFFYSKRGHGVELFPEFDPRRAIINIRCPQGTNIKETDRLARLVERRLGPWRGNPRGGDLKHVIANVGSGGGQMIFGGGGSGPHVANITLLFHDFEDRRRKSADAVKEIREALSDISGAEIKVEKEKEGPPTGVAVTVRIIGREFEELEKLSEQAKAMIEDVPGLVNLRSDLEATRPELKFFTDRRRTMLLGVNASIIGNFLKACVFGWKVSTYRRFNDEYDITIRLPESQRSNIQDIFRLHIPNNAGQPVPLSSLGTFEYHGGFGTINRVNRKRVVTLTADAEGRLDTEVLKDAQNRLEKLDLPTGYSIRYAGQKEEQEKAMSFLTKAFAFALLFIVLILVAQFNTLSAPFIIMTTVILSMIGVLSGLLICRMPFGIIMTGVGVISLAGVVVNNAIVLLDYTRQLQKRGMDIIESVLEAGATRLRPVLLTAVTTILGLLPMATGVSFDFHKMTIAWQSESSQWWASMAIAVIFGLGFATVLTLVVVPTFYVTIYRAAAHFGLGGLKKPQAEHADHIKPICE
ncbi:MAG: efflux RND transporter permease subunit [Planctomycetota bacterium]|nr:efflux RND transporter permease subunit [Planctomycetota bacterium]